MGLNTEHVTSSWTATYTFSDLVGRAAVFRDSLDLARQAAALSLPVLVSGESGTGKELLAQAIHTASPRASRPFVAVNCGITSDDLLAAELFGYADGAFTGAAKGGRKGKAELAHRGTLFLDEIQEMSPKMQVSLLRFLEEGRLLRVGAEQPVAVDVRIIAATNENLQHAIEAKRFRLDLYHRLYAFPIVMPPLRKRSEDMSLLATYFLTQLGFAHLHLAPEVSALFQRYAWPGNIRELRNVLQRAAYLAKDNCITLAEILPEVVEHAPTDAVPPSGSLRETEQALICQALAKAKGNLAKAAAELGIHRVTLYRKLKKFNCDPLLALQEAS